MAVRTYIPTILRVADFLKRFVGQHSVVLKERLGNGGYALLELVIDLVVILAAAITAGHAPGDPWSDFSSINTLTSTQINNVEGAVNKFWAAIGVTP